MVLGPLLLLLIRAMLVRSLNSVGMECALKGCSGCRKRVVEVLSTAFSLGNSLNKENGQDTDANAPQQKQLRKMGWR